MHNNYIINNKYHVLIIMQGNCIGVKKDIIIINKTCVMVLIMMALYIGKT